MTSELQLDDYDDDIEEIEDEDFAFILDGDGELKSILVPENLDNIPDSVYHIFKIFGITDPDEINERLGRTIH